MNLKLYYCVFRLREHSKSFEPKLFTQEINKLAQVYFYFSIFIAAHHLTVAHDGMKHTIMIMMMIIIIHHKQQSFSCVVSLAASGKNSFTAWQRLFLKSPCYLRFIVICNANNIVFHYEFTNLLKSLFIKTRLKCPPLLSHKLEVFYDAQYSLVESPAIAGPLLNRGVFGPFNYLKTQKTSYLQLSAKRSARGCWLVCKFDENDIYCIYFF